MAVTPNFNLPLLDSSADVSEDHQKINQVVEALDARLGEVATQLAARALAGHDHELGGVNGLIEALQSKAAATHKHALNDLSDVDVADAPEGKVLGRVAGGKWGLLEKGVSEADFTNHLSQTAPLEHQHDIGDVADLQAALGEKADKTEVLASLEGKADTSEVVSLSQIRRSPDRSGVQVNKAPPGEDAVWEDVGTGVFSETPSVKKDGQSHLIAHEGNLAELAAAAGVGPKVFISEAFPTGTSKTVIAEHKLGGVPNVFQAYLRCKSAQYTYLPGDLVILDGLQLNQYSQNTSTWSNSTHVGVKLGAGLYLMKKNDPANLWANVNITDSWEIIFIAVKYV